MKDQINSISSTIKNIKNKPMTKSICIPARGKSILPSIRPNQKVMVDAISPSSIYIGDIVLFQTLTPSCAGLFLRDPLIFLHNIGEGFLVFRLIHRESVRMGAISQQAEMIADLPEGHHAGK